MAKNGSGKNAESKDASKPLSRKDKQALQKAYERRNIS